MPSKFHLSIVKKVHSSQVHIKKHQVCHFWNHNQYILVLEIFKIFLFRINKLKAMRSLFIQIGCCLSVHRLILSTPRYPFIKPVLGIINPILGNNCPIISRLLIVFVFTKSVPNPFIQRVWFFVVSIALGNLMHISG